MFLTYNEIRMIRELLNIAQEENIDMLLHDIRTFHRTRDRFNGVQRQISREKRKKAKYKNSRNKLLRRKIKYA